MPYVGITPSRQKDSQNRVTYVAADGQTLFSANYAPGYVDVYVNGAKLQGPTGADFTATSGTNIVLNNPCALGDVVEIVAITTANPYDAYTKAQTDAKLNSYYAVATGTSDALAITTTPLVSALTDGLEIKVRTASSNTTTTPTVTISNLGVSKTIVGPGGAALQASSWVAGQEITLRYNATADRLELTTINFIQATNAQAVAGTVNNAIVTPASLAGAFTTGQSKTQNGYQKLPGGVIIQWGVFVGVSGASSQTANVTFPIAFPNSCFSVSTGVGLNTTDYDSNANYRTDRQDASVALPTITGFKAEIFADNNVGDTRLMQWIAFGY